MKADRNRMPALIILLASVLSALTFSGCSSGISSSLPCDTSEYTYTQSENESVLSENIPALSVGFDAFHRFLNSGGDRLL